MPSVNGHLKAVLLPASFYNHLWTRSSSHCYFIASKGAESNSTAKYEAFQGNAEVSPSKVLKQSILDQELQEIIWTNDKWKQKLSADSLLKSSKKSTEQLSEDVIYSSLELSDIGSHLYNISVLPYGFRLFSMNVKQALNHLFINVKFTPTVIRKCHLPYTVLTSYSLSSLILNKYSFRYIPHAFLSSSVSLSSQTISCVNEESNTPLKPSSDNVTINSVNNVELKMSEGKHKIIDEQKINTNHSESQEAISLMSVCINKDMSCGMPVEGTHPIQEHGDNPNSHNIYTELYFNLMKGEQTLQNVSSDLQLEATTSSFNNYSEPKVDAQEGVSTKGSLTHTDKDGKALMVDVGDKKTTLREAEAEARIYLGPEVGRLVKENKIKKGDVLTVAQISGIMAAKKTAELIPLCHNINLTKVDVICVLNEKTHSVDITSLVRTIGVTGVEMEALTAVSIAAMTVYDMCKAVTHDMVISDIRLVSKSGGKRNFRR